MERGTYIQIDADTDRGRRYSETSRRDTNSHRDIDKNRQMEEGDGERKEERQGEAKRRQRRDIKANR